MDDAELVRQLRDTDTPMWVSDLVAAADRIEALIAERDEARAAWEIEAATVKRFAERHERHLVLGAEVRARAEKAESERDAARDAALEEAAKVADECFNQNSLGRRDLYKWGIASGAQAIAAAIRALKGKSHE